MRSGRRFAFAVATALVAAAGFASPALGHADLIATKPRTDATLEHSPKALVLAFDEAIDIGLMQLHVVDRSGGRVDRGEPYSPRGRAERVAVRLRPKLDGAYTATYRLLSADGHLIAGRTRFRVLPPEPAGRGAREARQPPEIAPAEPVASRGTDVAFGIARGLGYLAIALAIGGSVFLVVAWLPALRTRADARPGWRHASTLFVTSARWVLFAAVLLGVLATAAAIVFEAAMASNISFWAALDQDAIDLVSHTNTVQAWAARLVVWLVLGGLLLVTLRPRQAPVLRRAALGADGVALGPMPGRPQHLLLALTVVALALTAPLAGHAASHTPEALLVCVDTAHVLCASVWIGGLGMLLIAIAVARRALPADQRILLLAGVVGRFSRMASIVVTVLVASGLTQAVVLVGSIDALVETAYGRLVLVKVFLLLGLLALGAYNQRRWLPQMRRLPDGGDDLGRAATLLRRAVLFEVAFLLIVLGVASVLVTTNPAAG